MDYDKDKVDEMVLALLYLTLHDGDRAWKDHDWDAMERLHAKGMIGNPVGKAKSIWLTEEGLRRSRELFLRHFTRAAHHTHLTLPLTRRAWANLPSAPAPPSRRQVQRVVGQRDESWDHFGSRSFLGVGARQPPQGSQRSIVVGARSLSFALL